MAVSATIRALVETSRVLTDKDKRKVIWYVIAVPIVLIFLLVSMLVYQAPDKNETFILSVLELKNEESIENDIDGNLIRCIYILHNGNIAEDKTMVKEFIKDNFIKQSPVTVTTQNGSYKEKKTVFLTFDEIIQRVKELPFSFTSDEVEILKFFMPYPQLEIDENYVMPCSGNITSPFGGRIHPITGEASFHTGIDICGQWHQPISSIADGEVVNVSTKKSGYGNHITIKHTINGKTFYSFYAHLSSISVSTGQTVTRGQTIACEGGAKTDNNPGTSTGHHLHFELRENIDGEFINPENIFKAGD